MNAAPPIAPQGSPEDVLDHIGPGTDIIIPLANGNPLPKAGVFAHAEAEVVRRVPASVFWPRPAVDSVLVRLRRRQRPPVSTPPGRLFRIVDEGFAERRKTVVIAQALVEYSGASLMTALRDLWLTVQYHLSAMSSSSWLVLGACIGVISIFWLRSS